MNEEYVKVIEELHKDYYDLKSSQEYAIGTKIKNLIDSLKHGRIWEYIKQEYLWRKLARFNAKTPYFDYSYNTVDAPLPKIAVYTCITGGYDNVENPKLSFPNVEYILYTDNENFDSQLRWKKRGLPEEAIKYSENAKRNRYCKMHPSILGDEYDYSIYIDGNICVWSDVTNLITTINANTGLAFHRHNLRNCIYKEAEACKIVKRGNIDKLFEQIDKYKKEGFPKNYGLLEATIILTDLHNPQSLEVLDTWWREYLNSSSMRDQIALPYILWKLGYTIEDIGNLGYDLQKNPKFRKVQHKKCMKKNE